MSLPAAFDYLALVLDSNERWVVDGPTLRLSSLADAALIAQPPGTLAEFDQRVSATWNLISQLRTPSPAPDAPESPGRGASAAGSLNNLQTWLERVLKTDKDIATHLVTLRALGKIRRGTQHASSGTRQDREAGLATFGIGWPVLDWAGAWGTISDRCAGALFGIAQAVRRA